MTEKVTGGKFDVRKNGKFSRKFARFSSEIYRRYENNIQHADVIFTDRKPISCKTRVFLSSVKTQREFEKVFYIRKISINVFSNMCSQTLIQMFMKWLKSAWTFENVQMESVLWFFCMEKFRNVNCFNEKFRLFSHKESVFVR